MKKENENRSFPNLMQILPRWLNNLGIAFLWRYACHSAMLAMALVHEARPAPTLPDTLLKHIPYVKMVHDYNYWLWILLQIPLALALWKKNRNVFLRFLYVGGALSLIRGVCIGLTGLGPVMGADSNAGMTFSEGMHAWLALINPIDALWSNGPHIYLTKDLFFSGHTATTFLLFLYCWKEKSLRWIALAAHLLTVAIVLFSHLHYTIDIVGAWAITYTLFVFAERTREKA